MRCQPRCDVTYVWSSLGYSNIIIDRPTFTDVVTSRLTHCHSRSARELYLYHKSYREGSETVDFTPLRIPGPRRQEIYGCAVGDFTLQFMGQTKHKFPSYGGPGVRSEVKLTQLVASVVEKWIGARVLDLGLLVCIEHNCIHHCDNRALHATPVLSLVHTPLHISSPSITDSETQNFQWVQSPVESRVQLLHRPPQSHCLSLLEYDNCTTFSGWLRESEACKR